MDFKGLARAMAPNVLFELIKQAWPLYGPWVLGIVIAVWSFLTDLPGPVAALLGLIAVLVGVAVIRLLGIRRSPVKAPVGDVMKAIEFQRSDLGQYVIVISKSIDEAGMLAASPYIDFFFIVQNFSVFDVFLEGGVDGHVEFGDVAKFEPLAQTPEFYNPRISRRQNTAVLGQPHQLFVTLRQYLNDNARSHLQGRRIVGGHVDFSLDNVKVWIGAMNDNAAIRSPLRIGHVKWELPPK